MAHLSTRHLLKGQGVPQLDHIQEKPGGEKQSLTNLLMCTCTCMWKGTFQEEVCLPFFIKKKVYFLFVDYFIQCGIWCSFSPPVSLSLFSRSRGTLCFIQYPTPCCYFHILLFCLFSVWAFGIYWSTVGFTPEGKDSSCPSCCWLPIAPQGRAGLLSPSSTCDRQTHLVQVLRHKLMSAVDMSCPEHCILQPCLHPGQQCSTVSRFTVRR